MAGRRRSSGSAPTRQRKVTPRPFKPVAERSIQGAVKAFEGAHKELRVRTGKSLRLNTTVPRLYEIGTKHGQQKMVRIVGDVARSRIAAGKEHLLKKRRRNGKVVQVALESYVAILGKGDKGEFGHYLSVIPSQAASKAINSAMSKGVPIQAGTTFYIRRTTRDGKAGDIFQYKVTKVEDFSRQETSFQGRIIYGKPLGFNRPDGSPAVAKRKIHIARVYMSPSQQQEAESIALKARAISAPNKSATYKPRAIPATKVTHGKLLSHFVADHKDKVGMVTDRMANINDQYKRRIQPAQLHGLRLMKARGERLQDRYSPQAFLAPLQKEAQLRQQTQKKPVAKRSASAAAARYEKYQKSLATKRANGWTHPKWTKSGAAAAAAPPRPTSPKKRAKKSSSSAPKAKRPKMVLKKRASSA